MAQRELYEHPYFQPPSTIHVTGCLRHVDGRRRCDEPCKAAQGLPFGSRLMFTADHVKPSDRAGDFFRYRPDN